jgi:dTDP-4-dehydrorhamnose reductase
VDEAEREPEACLRANADAPALLAAACARHGARLVAFSSDLVFDGVRRAWPYVESDAPSPLGVYGRSKASWRSACSACCRRHWSCAPRRASGRGTSTTS